MNHIAFELNQFLRRPAGMSGLQIGALKKLDEDPNKQLMTQVTVPVMPAGTDGVRARLASFYGSDGAGSFFIAGIGDEVILGFLNNDPTHPLILRSLYSSKRAQPYPPGAESNTKAIVTRSKPGIEFDEEKKMVTVLTPAGNKVELSDDARTTTLLDETGNQLTIDAVGNVDIISKPDLKQAALNITSQASTGFTAKGAMVMIN